MNTQTSLSLRENAPKPPRLMDQVTQAIRLKHYSPATEKAYRHWILRFIRFHDRQHPSKLGKEHITQFLSHLASAEEISASSQNQAFSSLLFLYKQILNVEFPGLTEVLRSITPKKLPNVLTREEVHLLFQKLSGEKWIIASLLYGTGMRISECLNLRVGDLDFLTRRIQIHRGKGDKDRITFLPQRLIEPMQTHLKAVYELHQKELREGYGRVQMPEYRKGSKAKQASDWNCQWVFPQKNLWFAPESPNP